MKRKLVVLCVFLIIILSSCGSKNEEEIEQYKSEAHYFYIQVDGIIQNINIIEGMDSAAGIAEDNLFSSTLNKAFFRSICLENLISVNQYYNGLDISIEQMRDLYSAIPQNEEVDKMRDIIDGLNTECMNLKKLLEDATEYNSNFIDEYNSVIGSITAQTDILYGYVDGVESAVHYSENNISDVYQKELDQIEQTMLGENDSEAVLQERDANNPVLVGESVNIKFLDFLYNKKADGSPCIVECNITFKSYDKDDGVVCLNFEIVSSETSEAVHVDDRMSSLVYALVDENMTKSYVEYEGVYREDTGSTLISVYEKGNVDCCINVNSNNFLQIIYSPPTEDNINGKSQFYSEDTIWFELK